ncbi:hypothetical protein DL764_001329 [Monosporascus ibericus]|uniref:Uncharacterized protein n=1 Tax=Monosporascus ibericus TaxID=155417 RepID=A0A4Q4TRN8_9PEZI|nr:hypothetical protein DL764_001329 [Monosporascus ibericus]
MPGEKKIEKKDDKIVPVKEKSVAGAKRPREENDQEGALVETSRMVKFRREEVEVYLNKGAPVGLTDKLNPDRKDIVVSQGNRTMATVPRQQGLAAAGEYWKEQTGGRWVPLVVTFPAMRGISSQSRRHVREQPAHHRPKIPDGSSSSEDDDEEKWKAEEEKDSKVLPPPEQGDKEQEKMKKKGKKGKKPRKGRVCPGCKKPGHVLLVCAGPPAEDGFLRGCPFHNTLAHNYDECQYIKRFFKTRDHLYYLISYRAGLPPIFTKMDWLDVAKESMPQPGYPLSVKITQRILGHQYEDFNYEVVEECPLYDDITTRSWDTIQQHWEELKGPKGIGQAAPAAPADVDEEMPDAKSKEPEPEGKEKTTESELARKLAKLPVFVSDNEEGMEIPVASEDEDLSVHSGDEDFENVPETDGRRY